MNDLLPKYLSGRYAELIVQLRLLEYAVQAAPPLEDSGNDLIAVRGEMFRAISVRSTQDNQFIRPRKQRHYHILAVVQFKGAVRIEASRVFLVPRSIVWKDTNNVKYIEQFELNDRLVNHLFSVDSNETCAPVVED